ncbi:hypothetical protein [Streptomyces sp. NBC_00687]|uniref:hypothetical protein n=1 Tax=Streptomyces sp. NBC_00687 TaxID=2975807 RepID=UPI00225A6234|nr:hypothetical protein [Streptomyces sp. NBC_00687]MCX4919935.1 hypothetical protein [Streptomyces sp. NBC_00687]
MTFEKIYVEDFPHPLGTVLRSRDAGLTTVVADEGEFIFFACCTTHYVSGQVCGHYPEVQDGQFVGPEVPIEDPTDQELECSFFGHLAQAAEQPDHA